MIENEKPVDDPRLCSTLAGKWSISTNEENYFGTFATAEEAIAQGKESDDGRFWIAQCVDPIQPEFLFNKKVVEDWIDRVREHDDYSGDWAAGQFCPNRAQTTELADELRPVIAAWIDRHGLRPAHFNIAPASVQQVDA